MNIFKQMKELFFSENKEGKLIRYLSILTLLGIFLLLMSSSLNKENNNINITDKITEKGDNMSVINEKTSYVEKLENDLEEILSVMKGVGETKVKIILERESAYEFKYNTNKSTKTTSETDNDGGEREIIDEDIQRDLVIMRSSDGSEKALKSVEKMPVIKGVLIASQGAYDEQIEYKITKAVSNFFDIPLYKVNVLPLEGR